MKGSHRHSTSVHTNVELDEFGHDVSSPSIENATQGNHPRRQRSLIRPERRPTYRRFPQREEPTFDENADRRDILGRSDSYSLPKKPKKIMLMAETKQCPSCWMIFSKIATIYAPSPLLVCCGMRTPEIRQAWREKMALCTIIFFLCIVVGFLTFGFQQVLCGFDNVGRVKQGTMSMSDGSLYGKALRLDGLNHPAAAGIPTGGSVVPLAGGRDISFMFQNVNGRCKGVLGLTSGADSNGNVINYFPCIVRGTNTTLDPLADPEKAGCHSSALARDTLKRLQFNGDIYYDWSDLKSKQRAMVVYNGHVLDFDLVSWLVPGIQAPPIFYQLMDPNSPYRGTDVTYLLNSYYKAEADCAMDILKVGVLDTTSMGCIISNVVLYVSLIVILGVVLTKFFLAVFFGWVLSWRLGSFREETYEERMKRLEAIEQWSENPNNLAIASTRSNGTAIPHKSSTGFLPTTSRYSSPAMIAEYHSRRNPSQPSPLSSEKTKISLNSASANSLAAQTRSGSTPPDSPRTLSRRSSHSSATAISNIHTPPTPPPVSFQPFNFRLAHTIMLVTCYSEGAEGMRTTLDSLAITDYPQSHKLILVIADGIITGSGNDMSTPDICLSMMKDFVISPEHVQPYSYVAIADGSKRHNMAKVYAGCYKYDDNTVPLEKQQRVPIILISKCGTPEEANTPKPGNRGKRDSQIILMSFLQHVMFDDRMTEMEYELFNAVWSTTGVSADQFEIVLMVDADTKVYPDSVTRMVSCMVRDPQIMGLCGETKIANKKDSWVSMIQVFEYYISHHQSKAFESVFGGVTCLPGCFCMYRIKAPKGFNGLWVPVLASPDIVEHYSENVVDTLHKKNLYLLGEDRFLTTLMLRTFPKRKMVFVPQAVCKTVVPDSFQVLLSQRRRWINSTVHNLLELVLIRDLCGTFCFSMQFVVFMELVGTTVLPAAICFTIYLIVISFIVTPVPVIPLMLLAIILGLPAVLILMTTRKLVYVGWMLIYLVSLPVWNLILPIYAFWHFDDFSWGQTRMVAGEAVGGDHSRKEGEFDSSRIVMRKWSDFERVKRRKANHVLSEMMSYGSSNASIEKLGYHTPSQLARFSSFNVSANQSEADSEFTYQSRGTK
ncbi:hypothetical protein K493DRAFT_291158 [Basidiobolus meristosporus CBS 931.73]|uniref:chitin synthase n=1 Tax=Basidiobolus meristosporus CBS 931.73 TaxID=1314790 RepID=A0A1Y1XMX8_9FUNG|nr:hypothetical protein K493DRAFT_291158 [Basidiobolus meristosporus CBS 931.73]|eukprot:ORX86704.1 hypothetical protein K493DRAFT_291158 [Basidiobolus meristosporus CBS 931.73]